jgi:sugar/nucleoside kinase (ribokinase family)
MAIECLCAGILFADVVGSPVERVPEAGELVPAERIQLSLGGCAANAGLDLARLGVRVGVAGCVGDDVLGQYISDTLARGGVDIAGIRQVSGINTACTMIINVRGQDRRFISSVGANTRMTVEHIPTAWLREAKVFYVGGYLMLPGLETQAMTELFRTARANGCKTVLDVVYIGSPNSLDALALLLPETDVFLPNDDEGKVLTGHDDPLAQAQAFRRLGAATVVITQGEKGCLLVSDGLRLRAGVYPTDFIGGTGAGDAFDAGYIMGLLLGEEPLGCIRWGAAMGASCVRSVSATESVFNRAEAEAFMREHALPIEYLD